jgi:hypothetical protein
MSTPAFDPDEVGTDTVEVWQCIGCGRIEAPQPCIGVCQDRKVVLVGKQDLDRAHEEIQRQRQRIDALRSLLAGFIRATPREGGWKSSWEQLQARTRQALAEDDRLRQASAGTRSGQTSPDR